MAVAKVDELTRQLEDVQKGRGHSQPTSPASMELDKLRAELLVSFVHRYLLLSIKAYKLNFNKHNVVQF